MVRFRLGEASGIKAREDSNVPSVPLHQAHEEAWSLLLRTSVDLVARVERDLGESAGGMVIAEFDILNALIDPKVKGGRLSMSALTKFTRLSRSAVTRLVDKMEATHGYVRKQSRDGRMVLTAITSEGRAAMKNILRPAYERAVTTHFANFITQKNATVLASILIEMVRGVEKEQETT